MIAFATAKIATRGLQRHLIAAVLIDRYKNLTTRLAMIQYRLKSADTYKGLEVQGIKAEPNKRTINRRKAEALDPGKEISLKLQKCRTSKDFIQYARKKGAKVTINSNHAKISKNGVVTIIASPGRKKYLHIGARKQQIVSFSAMGIAWDE